MVSPLTFESLTAWVVRTRPFQLSPYALRLPVHSNSSRVDNPAVLLVWQRRWLSLCLQLTLRTFESLPLNLLKKVIDDQDICGKYSGAYSKIQLLADQQDRSRLHSEGPLFGYH